MNDKPDVDSGLPNIAGAVKAVADSKPAVSLFDPAAKIFGQYLGERAAELTDRWRAKRRSNLAKQIALADKVDGAAPDSEPSERQAEFAFEWSESAQRIDFDSEPELAALWSSLLGDIRNNRNEARDAIAALKQLRPEDASALLNIEHSLRGDNYNQPMIGRLVAANLLAKKDWRALALALLATFAFVFTMITYLAAIKPPSIFLDERPLSNIKRIITILQEPSVLISFVIFVGSMGLGFFLLMQNSYRLTSLGKKLRQQGRRYLSEMKR